MYILSVHGIQMFMKTCCGCLTRTISQMADLEIAVQTDHGHCDEAPTSEEEARPAVEPAALPAKQPAVGKTGHNEKGLSCHCKEKTGGDGDEEDEDRDHKRWGVRKRQHITH